MEYLRKGLAVHEQLAADQPENAGDPEGLGNRVQRARAGVGEFG